MPHHAPVALTLILMARAAVRHELIDRFELHAHGELDPPAIVAIHQLDLLLVRKGQQLVMPPLAALLQTARQYIPP